MQKYKTKMKKVKFEDKEICQLEIFHNLVENVHPNQEQEI